MSIAPPTLENAGTGDRAHPPTPTATTLRAPLGWLTDDGTLPPAATEGRSYPRWNRRAASNVFTIG
ncbi:MAG: hypothetical protein WD557_05955 [Dehalococcoidia bacterium]